MFSNRITFSSEVKCSGPAIPGFPCNSTPHLDAHSNLFSKYSRYISRSQNQLILRSPRSDHRPRSDDRSDHHLPK
jgi:hypothetical protein